MLLDDLTLVVAATNASLAAVGGPAITAEEHRRDFRRPISAYYVSVLGRPVHPEEFAHLDRVFHLAYNEGLAACALATGAREVLGGWTGIQSLLSMWFHDDLVPTLHRYDLAGYFVRVDGLRASIGGGP